jgi:hypothetical protein
LPTPRYAATILPPTIAQLRRKPSTLFTPAWWQGSDQTKGLKYAKNSYASVAEYLGVFEPLLFEEVKAQIVQGRSSEDDGGRLSLL